MRTGIKTISTTAAALTCLLAAGACFAEAGGYVIPKREPVINPALYRLSDDPLKVWVFFTDKGVFTDSELQAALESVDISGRALLRRAKAGAAADAGDLPVKAAYIEAVERIAMFMGHESRWLNSVSALVSRSSLAELADLPFVADISLVAAGTCSRLILEREEFTFKGNEGFDESRSWMGHEGAFYGRSYDQLAQIEVIEAHRRGYYGRGVVVAVIDGGFMNDHRALMHADIIGEWDFIFNDSFTGYDPEQGDSRGQPVHGTGCWSTIAGYDPGNLIGAAPFASFILAKSEDDRWEKPVEEDNWVAAIEWCERMGADVASSSLSYKDWYSNAEFDGIIPPASRAADRAYEMGMVICTSAGNGGPMPMTLGAPTDAEGVLSIGAVDSTGIITRFSSRGPSADGRIKPNICALGRHTTAVSPYSYDRYGLWNGTSLSCPLAAGAIALLIEAHPGWPMYKICEAVENTATHARHPDNAYGYGIVQIAKAIDYPSISGFVSDRSSGKRIGNARIQFSSADTSGAVSADDGGFYLLVNMPDGEYELTVTAAGYADSEPVKVSVPPDDTYDFALPPKD